MNPQPQGLRPGSSEPVKPKFKDLVKSPVIQCTLPRDCESAGSNAQNISFTWWSAHIYIMDALEMRVQSSLEWDNYIQHTPGQLEQLHLCLRQSPLSNNSKTGKS